MVHFGYGGESDDAEDEPLHPTLSSERLNAAPLTGLLESRSFLLSTHHSRPDPSLSIKLDSDLTPLLLHSSQRKHGSP